jgi:hypothetical protein
MPKRYFFIYFQGRKKSKRPIKKRANKNQQIKAGNKQPLKHNAHNANGRPDRLINRVAQNQEHLHVDDNENAICWEDEVSSEFYDCFR